MAQNHNVTITHGDPVTGILTLSDRGKTDVDPGDTVTWKIGPGSGVGSIISITDDPTTTDVFNPDPAPFPTNPPTNPGTDWRGTVNPNIAKGTTEDYTICWNSTDAEIPPPPCYDPKIEVNP